MGFGADNLTQPCDVRVWLVGLENEGETVLSPDEELRAARLRFAADRARWIRSRSALRMILSGATGVPAPEIRFVLGPHGKPALVDGGDVEFSLSHSGSWAMVAITRGVPVGIDIERIREGVNIADLLARLGERNQTGSPDDLFRAWARREAVTKAAGGALMDRPEGDFRVCDLDAPPGYAAALALIGRDPVIRPGTLVPQPAPKAPEQRYL